MRVSLFTFVRNGTQLAYPYVESIRSALPLCDEFVVAVGKSQDDTRERIAAIGDPRIRIIDTVWNEALHERGFVYAQQKMIAWFNCTGDWAFYLEGDEILHEDELPLIRASMERYLNDPRVESLVFDYYHFYGTADTLAVSPGWYRSAPRIVRNTRRAIAGGGLYFLMMDRKKRGRYPRAAKTGARIYHYGYVRPVASMNEKMRQVSKFWSKQAQEFNAYGRIDPQALGPFGGAHPALMRDWLAENAPAQLHLDPTYQPSARERRHRWMMRLERMFKLELSKKFYRLVE